MKPINQQTVVITGASSGIGRETALAFAERGASLVLASRNETTLREVATEIQQRGGKAHVVVTDVGIWEDIDQLAREAVEQFGGIDTWVNNAAVNEHARVEQMTIEEIERIIQVDLMGQIYGMKAALSQMKRQGNGTIINVASILAKRGAPLHAPYVAAKHGIAGFTETLRLELMQERSPINLTLVMPAYINTPFFINARSKLGVKPRPVPPIYEPQVVAEAVLFAAEHRRRDIIVGGSGAVLDMLQRISPSLVDRLMLFRGFMFEQQKTGQPDDGQDNLFNADAGVRSTIGEWGQESKSTSLYTRHLEFYPNRKRLLFSVLTVGAVMLTRRLGRQSQ
ncbi:MAG TPA: SDR family oxidoreductase [Noviherbaspirillum sp.]|jgi:short-subunit dehydrogenase|uniref:SDR family oxidoreductase n=1 Tax=Noviherbaspirillum sp. TaxID=1926288 RepID=UPI002DDD7590|nr:SDR family oxidoreductase [Noviherbaspirillum sp.]HEV2610879.1 SDR family oxidoreductase [Noviherbaspirillum sp.]